MVAEARDIDAGNLAGLEDSEALGNLDRVAIDEDLDSVFGVGEMDSGTGDRGPGREIWSGVGLGLGGGRLVRVLELGCGGYGPGEEEGGSSVAEEP
ncbi:hypothetical protein TorRG33x02_210160 [Trema orientale]|uniref:Uncharacterized protein n=1 Tax=Trema orientale TaxID=63057 RepID=A0A2P5ECA7_TREOI|nr:hypothetical protein TorRG33x02_210160 [Trema orientale]